MTSFPVVPASPADLPACAELIGHEFSEDPTIRAIIPGDEDREERVGKVYLAVLRNALVTGGAVDVVKGEDGGIRAVALWVPPEPTETSLADRLLLRARLGYAIGLRHREEAEAAEAYYDAQHPDFPHWYLDTILVSKHAQGEGNGTHLLQHRLAEIDQQGLPVYLEATTVGSRRLYERFGFRPWGIGEDLGHGATAMLRPGPPH